MNTLRYIATLWLALFLPALFAPILLAQEPLEPTFLPEGIEATGDTAEVRALTTWAEEYQQSHPEEAERAAGRALALARELEDQKGIGQSLMVLGGLASTPWQKEEYYIAAREAFEHIGDQRRLYTVQQGLGAVYGERGELDRALDTFFDALEGFKHLDDTKGRAGVLNNVGLVHMRQGNLQKAQAYFEQAITLAETLNEPSQLLTPLNNYGITLTEEGSYENAEFHFRRALAISEEEGYRYFTACSSNNLGYLLNEQGQHRDALPFLFTAQQLANELGDDGLLFAVYDELGKAYMGLGQYDQALQYAHESLVLARESVSSRRQMVAHQTLSQIYEAAGDDGQALANYRQYAVIKDSVFTAERAEVIAQMQTRYETEEKQRAIERLEHENQLRLILLVAGVGGLLLLLGFLYYRYRLKQKANRLLEELDKTKSRFFANISHEFRTPLTVILGGVQDALAGRFEGNKEKLTEQHRAILRNSRQLQRLVNEVLDLNRLEAGKLELQLAPGDLVRSLRRIIEADTPLAERNGISLTFEHDVESCLRLYDEEKLEKIVGNLLSNALKFTPRDGSVRVSLNCGRETKIIVSDDGPGIPTEAQDRVFERFVQVEDGSQHGGTGIGLALAKELAELHGGTISMESKLGEGSTFTVWLPLEKVALDDRDGEGGVPLPQPTESATSEEFDVGGDGVDLSGQPATVLPDGDVTSKEPDCPTVLVIEDNDDVRAYVRRSLEKTYRVLEAVDGESGLQQARADLPDLIVSDVMLPGIDGNEVTRRLKAEPSIECIPVIMLTARATEEDQTEGYGAGAEVYITKPFSPETLRAAVARLLEERRRLRKQLKRSVQRKGEEVSQNDHRTLEDHTRTAVLEHLYDEDFGVEELAVSLSMSRRTLHRRMKREVGLSPSDFIRTLRLERSRELLSDGAGSVSEVAYAVGFNSRITFSRAYTAHYGMPPSAHRDRKKNVSE